MWPETATALQTAISLRPSPINEDDSSLCFVTSRGNRYVRTQASKKSDGRYVTINTIARKFQTLQERAGVVDQNGRGFYGMRHTFETIAGDTLDQVAIDSIMGHSDESMSANYRKGIAKNRTHGLTDERLVAVVNAVRNWLWPE